MGGTAARPRRARRAPSAASAGSSRSRRASRRGGAPCTPDPAAAWWRLFADCYGAVLQQVAPPPTGAVHRRPGRLPRSTPAGAVRHRGADRRVSPNSTGSTSFASDGVTLAVTIATSHAVYLVARRYRGRMSRFGGPAADLEVLRERWARAWPGALALWSRYTQLHDPTWCFTRGAGGRRRARGLLRDDPLRRPRGRDQPAAGRRAGSRGVRAGDPRRTRSGTTSTAPATSPTTRG